jgi:uncharacterized protein (TIGR03435 family)
MRRTVCWATVLSALFWAGQLVAQGSQGAAQREKPPMMAKDADPDWEVVTVKPSDPNDQYDRFDAKGRTIVIENNTVESILRFAYGLQRSQIAGAPDWIRTERFDANGTANIEGQPDREQFQSMIQKLLAQRFRLKVHHDRREIPVFALTVAKGGPKMAMSKRDPDGLPDDSGGRDKGRQTRKYTNVSMADLAMMLQFHLDRPVVDRTGIKGRYDFRMQWTVDDAPATEPDAPPGLFTAIQEQIGLKLEPVKAAADVLVVDRVERPGAN